jgi:dTDP-4-dehydrorhamnose 3,5-epimerase-like enzyme
MQPHRILLPTFTDGRGHLTVMEKEPFEVKRAFWIYGARKPRAQHSHAEGEQLIVAVNGGFIVRLRDGDEITEWPMLCRMEGLYVPPGVWIELDNFSYDAVALVLCSNHYDKTDVKGESCAS